MFLGFCEALISEARNNNMQYSIEFEIFNINFVK